MLPASLGRTCLGRRLLAPRGWALLGTGTGAGMGTASCLRWRHQPPLLLRPARQSIGTQAGGLRAEKPGENSKGVSVQRARNEETLLSAAQKVKEAGRDFTYFIVVLVGIGVTGGLFYVIFKELFSSSSPNKIYGDALEKCRSHPQVVFWTLVISLCFSVVTVSFQVKSFCKESHKPSYGKSHVVLRRSCGAFNWPEVIGAFGDSIKGYGEATRRGRRQHVRILKQEDLRSAT
ncbi:mitochondrial import inner membrane translocase subunit Tim21 isoform X3 [Pipra filicauda]|uniref:Mitochondrial import inner membrane translocase subunit Tim21 n=1 Tax=Pipra filicauda TaxID=649802 RepID=A0A7R5L129_9PASS|nr:mitochondrial import inner membrane translocase subunit Tim21 isoform X3 [Pipra filicauda]